MTLRVPSGVTNPLKSTVPIETADISAGLSRATVGPGETFLWGPSGKKIFDFFKLHILVYFIYLNDGRAPNVAGPGVTYPHFAFKGLEYLR